MLARTPLAQTCTVKDAVHPRITNWVDISIEGPSLEAVEAAVSEYRRDHASCDPQPAFYDIQVDGQRAVVNGSRGVA